MKFYPNDNFIIIPSFSLEYIAYIGLSCNHELEEGKKFTLDFHVILKYDFDGEWLSGNNIIRIDIFNNIFLISKK